MGWLNVLILSATNQSLVRMSLEAHSEIYLVLIMIGPSGILTKKVMKAHLTVIQYNTIPNIFDVLNFIYCTLSWFHRHFTW